MCVCVSACARDNVCVRMCVREYLRARIRVCVCVRACARARVCVCVYEPLQFFSNQG